MDNMAATGHEVILYSDMACSNEIGQVTKDGSCYAAPSDVSKPIRKRRCPRSKSDSPIRQ